MIKDGMLTLSKLSSRNQFHSLSDLLRIFYAADASFNILQVWHKLILKKILEFFNSGF